MHVFTMHRKAILLQMLLFLINIFIGQCQNLNAIINAHMEPTSFNYNLFGIDGAKYDMFRDSLFNINTATVNLKYGFPFGGNEIYIIDINKEFKNYNISLFFSCVVNQSSSSIECKRNVNCNNVSFCSNGFGISWTWGEEYIFSPYLENVTVNCGDSQKNVTCYSLKTMYPTTSTETIPTASDTYNIDTVTMTSSELDTESTAEFISTSLYTFNTTNSTFTYTLYQNDSVTEITSIGLTDIVVGATMTLDTTRQGYTDDETTESTKVVSSTSLNTMSNFPLTTFIKSYSTEGTAASDSSIAVIAGVTVGFVILIVIIVVIVVVIFMKRRNVRKKLARNDEIQNSRLELVEHSNSDSIYSKQVLNFDECSKDSIGIEATNNEQKVLYNTNSYYIDPPSKRETRNGVTRKKTDMDYEGIEDDQSLDPPDRLVSCNTDNGCYYSTLNSNRGSLIPHSSNRNDGGINGLTDGNYSSFNKVHPVSPQDEYTIVNKNVGYTDIKDIEQNRNCAAQHEYNNMKQHDTTIEINEPTKNVYSKLRDNIRHFEHPYGDVGVSIQIGEDNSTLEHDNAYFILEKEEI